MFKRFYQQLIRRKVPDTVVSYLAVCWLLVQVVGVLQPMLGLAHWLVSAFVLICIALFPGVIYLSWFYRFSVRGLVKIKHLTPHAGKQTKVLQWSTFLFICTLSLWAAYQYWWQMQQQLASQHSDPRPSLAINSIAVLPFNASGQSSQAKLVAAGVAEELVSLLGQHSELNVAAASSVFALLERGLSAAEIAARLGVDAYISGDIRIHKNQLKIEARLLDVSQARLLWSDTFTRGFADIFTIEQEISRSIVNLAADRVLEQDGISMEAKTASSDAYVLYLQGREQYRRQTSASIMRAKSLFEKSIALDPEYVDAYVALADSLMLLAQGQSRFGKIDTQIAASLAMSQLQKVFAREPNNARSYAILAKLQELENDLDNALLSLKRSLEINPSLAIAHMWQYTIARQTGDHALALQSIQTAVQLDPISVSNLYNLGFAYSLRGNYTQAEQIFKRLREEFPDSPQGYAGLANNFFMQGKLALSAFNWWLAHQASPENAAFQSSYLNSLVSLGLGELLEQHTDEPFYDASKLIIAENFPGLFAAMEFQLKAYPDDPWLQFEAGWYQLLFGEESLGLELLLQSHEGLTPQDMFTAPMCSPGIEFAWALQQQGKIGLAHEYIQKCQQLADNVAQSGLIDSFADHLQFRIDSLQGNLPAAQASLSNAVKNGWREWWTLHDPLIANSKNAEGIWQRLAFIEQQLNYEKSQALELFAENSQ